MKTAQPAAARVLLVTDDDCLARDMQRALSDVGLSSAIAPSMAEGCAQARTGEFPVVVTAEAVFDGTWRRLGDLACRFYPGFVVIVVTTRAECVGGLRLGEGVFEVLGAPSELPRLGKAALCAMWAAFLEGAAPRPREIQQIHV
jgi:DNA-binding NtrC family response regulator